MLKIKELRESLRLTQSELGAKLELTGHNVGDWERGKCQPSIEDLIKLASIFNVTVDYLIGNSDDFGNVTSSVAPASNLTQQEQTLLQYFNKLGIFEREAILVQIKALAKSMANASN